MKLRWIGLALALLLSLASGANAHDQLVDSSPSNGAVLEPGVQVIALTFAEDLLDLGSGAQIIITGPKQDQLVNNGCALIDGRVASTTIQLVEEGDYVVGWRVVSGDGHPISGSLAFSVSGSNGFVADPNFQTIDCANAITQADYLPNPEPANANYWLLFGSLGVVAALLFFFLRPKDKMRGQGPKGQD
jgi:copper resistance protein C